jgi:hypothetical protein
MKKLIDVIRSIVLAMPMKVQLGHTDRYIDNSLVVVAVFGLAAAYVMTPDGKVTTVWQKGNLAVARRFGYVMHETQFSRWIRDAGSDELLKVRDSESRSQLPNRSLVNAIQHELDRRIGYRIAA